MEIKPKFVIGQKVWFIGRVVPIYEAVVCHCCKGAKEIDCISLDGTTIDHLDKPIQCPFCYGSGEEHICTGKTKPDLTRFFVRRINTQTFIDRHNKPYTDIRYEVAESEDYYDDDIDYDDEIEEDELYGSEEEAKEAIKKLERGTK